MADLQTRWVDPYVNNATPQSIHLGTDVQSGRTLSVVPLPRPMHMPFFLFYAKKGPTTVQRVDGNSFVKLYGDETLQEDSPYFNHASLFIKRTLEDGGTILAKRLVDEENMKVSSMRLSIEYVETTVDECERDINNRQFKRDQTGKPVKTGRKIPGILYRYVVDEVPHEEQTVGTTSFKIFNFGLGTEMVGELTDGHGTASKRIPLMDFAVSSPGVHGNLNGLRIWAPVSNAGTPMNLTAFHDTGSYPFRMSVMKKEAPTANAVVQTTLNGTQEFDFTLKPNSKSKTGVLYHLTDNFVDQYNDMYPSDPLSPPIYGQFSRLHVYQENIDRLLHLFTSKEVEAEQIGDFSATVADTIPTDKYRFNLFGGKHSDGFPYQTFRIGDLGTNGVILDENVVVWAKGGKDGEMNDDLFARAVENWLEEVADPNGQYMDDVTYNDSTFWDSGFPLETKLKMGKYISTRKDRWVCVSTHVSGEENLIPVVEENARLVAIKNALRLNIDSVVYGTNVYRAILVKGSCRLEKSVSNYRKRIPVSYELLGMIGKYWGSTSGRANSRYDYTEGDNNFFKYTTDVSHSWTPYHVRNKAWDAGAMWGQNSENKRCFFPAFRNIYEDETSPIMGIRTMLIHVELNKIFAEGHRVGTGKDWTRERFEQYMQAWYNNQLKDYKFGAKSEVEVEIHMTDIDLERGYQWHVNANVYTDNQKTVQIAHTTDRRRSDKPDSSGAFVV